MSEPRISGLSEAAAAGDRLLTLRSLRDLLAKQIETCESSRDVAALSRQLVLVLEEIAALAPPVEPKGTVLDEVTARRRARFAAS